MGGQGTLRQETSYCKHTHDKLLWHSNKRHNAHIIQVEHNHGKNETEKGGRVQVHNLQDRNGYYKS